MGIAFASQYFMCRLKLKNKFTDCDEGLQLAVRRLKGQPHSLRRTEQRANPQITSAAENLPRYL